MQQIDSNGPPAYDYQQVEKAVEAACSSIAPTWPLDRFIAVNPLWGLINLPLPEVSARLAAFSGERLLMPRAWYREAWQAGEFNDGHLENAISEHAPTQTLAQMKSLLDVKAPGVIRRACVTDVADAQRDLGHGMSWRVFVVQSISQLCAAYFDEGQAQLGPHTADGLYASWHRQAVTDKSPAILMGLRNYADLIKALPSTPQELLAAALRDLDILPTEQENYLSTLLLEINGWAAWCAYRRWMARLGDRDDTHIVELLAIRLAWEWMLYRAQGDGRAARWSLVMAIWTEVDYAAQATQKDDWLFQRALEIAYQKTIFQQLTAELVGQPVPANAAAQVVFCIDVRSEVFRRALEAQSPTIQTLGFAGFFGLPLEYKPLASFSARPQLPGLLAPRLQATDVGVAPSLAATRTRRLDAGLTWKQFKAGAISGFSFVETMGFFYAAKLLSSSLGYSRPVADPESAGLNRAEHASRKPRLEEEALSPEARCDLAVGILRGMSLTRNFARLLVLIGHGSETVNNPHAAGLDCGACCGQTGAVNAQVLASLLNDPRVRAGFAERGIAFPDTTHVVAGLHNTTTDEVKLFDIEGVPASHQDDVSVFRAWLEHAGHRARQERAPRLEITAVNPADLRSAMLKRSRDWSQVRAEWGLANNASFVVAPRTRSQHLNFAGRTFLQDYRWEEDKDFSILESIMTAPVLVAHWINMQYYASTVNNQRYGSGNKVLHNIVGGHIGVFEGNSGDLRIGLPMQSLHDGTSWMHVPLRLSVFIEAPRTEIERIYRKHISVKNLVDNEWLYLFQIDGDAGSVWAYSQGAWKVKT